MQTNSVRRALLIAATTLIAVGASAQRQEQPPPAVVPPFLLPRHFREVLLTDSEAILLEHPELASPGGTGFAAWAPSGRYILAVRREESVRQKLSGVHNTRPTIVAIWNANTRKHRDVYTAINGISLPDTLSDAESVWLNGADVVFALTDRKAPAAPTRPAASGPQPKDRVLLRIDARTASVRVLARVPEAGESLKVHSRQPLAILSSRSSGAPKLLWLIRADGTIQDLTPLVRSIPWREAYWNENEARIELDIYDEARRQSFCYDLNIARGQLTGPREAPDRGPRLSLSPGASGELNLGHAEPSDHDWSDLRFGALLLMSNRREQNSSSVVIANEAKTGEISPKQDAVFYISPEGAVWVRRFVRLKRAEYEAARRREERDALIRQAKRFYGALLGYAWDSHDMLPDHIDEFLFLKAVRNDVWMIEQVVYTFPGGRLADIQKPEETELAYFPTVDGRVVLYADRSVRFVPNK